MEKFVNPELLSHPLNWGLVWLVAVFGAFAWLMVSEHLTSTLPPVTS